MSLFWQGVCFGVAMVMLPSLLLFAAMLWRAPLYPDDYDQERT